MLKNLQIRPEQKCDLTQIKHLYNHHIKNTHVNFETQPHTDAYMQKWFSQFGQNSRYQAFVVIQGGDLLGFACSQKFKPKPAYLTSVETTIYLAEQAIGQGLGKKLMQHLLAHLTIQDVRAAFASVALPNDASIALNKSLGFKQVGHFSQVGRKFDQFYDVIMLEYLFT